MAEPVAPGVPRDVRVATPATWFDLDLDPRTSARSMARLIEERVGTKREQAATRRELASMLEKAAADARARGAVFASVLSDVLEGRPVAASLIVSLAGDRAPVTGDDGEARAAAIADVLGRPGGPVEGADIRVVELPAGWAVRARRREVIKPEGLGGHAVEVETLQYFTLMPATTNLLLLSFSTPNIGLADPMAELFDAMAESVRWRW